MLNLISNENNCDYTINTKKISNNFHICRFRRFIHNSKEIKVCIASFITVLHMENFAPVL